MRRLERRPAWRWHRSVPPGAHRWRGAGGARRPEALLLNLYRALPAASALSFHVVAEKGLGVPSDVRSAIQALVAGGVLEADLGTRLSAAIGMRNRIAHQYGTLDLALVHAAARDGLPDLEELAAALATACGI